MSFCTLRPWCPTLFVKPSRFCLDSWWLLNAPNQWHCKQINFTIVKWSHFFFGDGSGNSKLWFGEERSSSSLQGKYFEKNMKSNSHTATGSRKLWFWNLRFDKLYCQWFYSFFLIKCHETQRVKAEFVRSAVPQYFVYSELGNIHHY